MVEGRSQCARAHHVNISSMVYSYYQSHQGSQTKDLFLWLELRAGQCRAVQKDVGGVLVQYKSVLKQLQAPFTLWQPAASISSRQWQRTLMFAASFSTQFTCKQQISPENRQSNRHLPSFFDAHCRCCEKLNESQLLAASIKQRHLDARHDATSALTAHCACLDATAGIFLMLLP